MHFLFIHHTPALFFVIAHLHELILAHHGHEGYEHDEHDRAQRHEQPDMRGGISLGSERVIDGIDDDGDESARAAHKSDERVRLRTQRLWRDVRHECDGGRTVRSHRHEDRQQHDDERHQKPHVFSSHLSRDKALRLVKRSEEGVVIDPVLLDGKLFYRAVLQAVEPRLDIGVLPTCDKGVHARLFISRPI